MFMEPAGMYSIRLWISLVNGVALPLTLCDKSLNNESMEMERGDKCGTRCESENIFLEITGVEDVLAQLVFYTSTKSLFH